MNNICVYFHINPIKQEVFYVGIGLSGIRPYRLSSRTKLWKNIVKKYGYDVIIIHDNLTYEEASELEIKYIEQIGRRDKGLGPLVNNTSGGDGIRGYINLKGPRARQNRLIKQKERDSYNKEIIEKSQAEILKIIENIGI